MITILILTSLWLRYKPILRINNDGDVLLEYDNEETNLIHRTFVKILNLVS